MGTCREGDPEDVATESLICGLKEYELGSVPGEVERERCGLVASKPTSHRSTMPQEYELWERQETRLPPTLRTLWDVQ